MFARFGFRGATMQQIADAAALPKANLHYYFGNKQNLYLRVLENILDDWLSPLEGICARADPKTAIAGYVRRKISFSFNRPAASKLFANEDPAGRARGPPVAENRLTPVGGGEGAHSGWLDSARTTARAGYHPLLLYRLVDDANLRRFRYPNRRRLR